MKTTTGPRYPFTPCPVFGGGKVNGIPPCRPLIFYATRKNDYHWIGVTPFRWSIKGLCTKPAKVPAETGQVQVDFAGIVLPQS